jgi:hypothetical protein
MSWVTLIELTGFIGSMGSKSLVEKWLKIKDQLQNVMGEAH